MEHKSNEKAIKSGEIMLLKGEDKQRGTWKTGRTYELLVGKDGIIGSARIKTTKWFLE